MSFLAACLLVGHTVKISVSPQGASSTAFHTKGFAGKGQHACCAELRLLLNAFQALVNSTAISSALEQIVSLPDPLAIEPRLACFLEAIMSEQGQLPRKLASAAVNAAAAARKDGGQASLLTCLSYSCHHDWTLPVLSVTFLCGGRIVSHVTLNPRLHPNGRLREDVQSVFFLLQEFGTEARHALHTVSLLIRRVSTRAAVSTSSSTRSGEEAQMAQQCGAKEAALDSAQSAE